MDQKFPLRRVILPLALSLPSVCWGLTNPSALIVTETGSPFQSDINATVTFLSGRMTAAGYTVATNVGVPAGSMSAYNQVWDIRADTALSGSDITAYVTYMAGGGALFAIGENGGCCSIRDSSIAALILAAGGGTVTLETFSANTQTVNAPFTGPDPLTSLTYAAVGGFTSIGNGAFITHDTPTTGGAVIFGPGTMTNATSGVLASVLDINFLDTTLPVGVSQPLADNLIAYFNAPTPITPPGATSFTFTGPGGGLLNTASTNFTVTPNAAYTGTITITPSGGGLSTPIVLTFSASSTGQTFTIAPTAVGPVTLTPSNNGSLTNPSALTYNTPSGAPAIGTATVSGTSAIVAFTPPGNNGGSAITSYRATCSPGNFTATGASSPITVPGLSPGNQYTCTATATNGVGVSASSAPSNQISVPATTYTLAGPAGGPINTASSNFTITPSAMVNGNITINLSGGGLTGSIVKTFSNSSLAQTFTITPTSLGPVTLTPSNNASLTNPPSITYATPPGAPVIGTAVPGTTSASVSFAAPATGGSAITAYTVTCSPGNITGTGASSPVTVTGLTGLQPYTCTVSASNAVGAGPASGASNQVIPAVPPTPAPATFVLLSLGLTVVWFWNRRRHLAQN